MKRIFTKKETSKDLIEREKIAVLEEMECEHTDTEKYSKMVDNLSTLCSLDKNSNSIDVNTVITVAGSLVGIMLILKYEKLDIITSKALGFVPKLKM